MENVGTGKQFRGERNWNWHWHTALRLLNAQTHYPPVKHLAKVFAD
jgi:hypothetical protein